MIKVNTKMQFMGYKPNDGGDMVIVDKLPEDEEELEKIKELPVLTLSGFENGMHTGKSVSGKIDLLKDEFHDLLNGEMMDGWAIFAVKIVD